MTKDEVLVAEDDPQMVMIITRLLTNEGYAVRSASNGEEALELIWQKTPDLLVLDILMPRMDGLTLCKKLRKDPVYNRLPILFLSALAQIDQVVEGLNAGGDDYITKPFEIKELVARVKALLRRIGGESGDPNTTLKIGSIVLDGNTYEVRTPSTTFRLTATEYRLLRHMTEHAEQVLSYMDLLQEVWSYPPGSGDPDLVRTHIRNIRAKIEEDPDAKYFIQTIHGIGYMVTAKRDVVS